MLVTSWIVSFCMLMKNILFINVTIGINYLFKIGKSKHPLPHLFLHLQLKPLEYSKWLSIRKMKKLLTHTTVWLILACLKADWKKLIWRASCNYLFNVLEKQRKQDKEESRGCCGCGEIQLHRDRVRTLMLVILYPGLCEICNLCNIRKANFSTYKW